MGKRTSSRTAISVPSSTTTPKFDVRFERGHGDGPHKIIISHGNPTTNLVLSLTEAAKLSAMLLEQIREVGDGRLISINPAYRSSMFYT